MSVIWCLRQASRLWIDKVVMLEIVVVQPDVYS